MCYYGLLWILDDHDIINIPEYHGIIMNSGQSCYIMDYRGLWTIMHYLELSYPGLLWVIYFFFAVSWMMDYRGLSWASVDYRGLL